MAKKMLIDATHPEETRVVVADGNKVEEFDFENLNKRQLAGNIYLAKVTRVEPSLQAAFIDYGGNRHGFLAFSEIHPDYYQIPKADRDAILAEERALAAAQAEADEAADTKAAAVREARGEAGDADEGALDAAGADDDGGKDDGKDGAKGDAGRKGRSRSRSRSRSRRKADDGALDDSAEATSEDDAPPLARDELTEEAREVDRVVSGSAAEMSEAATETVGQGAVPDRGPESEADDGPVKSFADTGADDAGADESPDDTNSDGESPDDGDPDDAGSDDESPDDGGSDDGGPDETGTVRTIAEDTGLEDETVTADPSGMETVDVEDDDGDDDGDPVEEPSPRRTSRSRGRKKAADKDENVETVGEEDEPEDMRPARAPRPKARKYKIQEVVKVRQIMLVQVVKEERGNKGAALTTYLSLAGRYCVLMPNTARGGGISRKITNAVDRKKLKEIAQEIDVPKGAGLIVRTAGAKRTKTEIKRDYEYLQRMWEQVRELTLKSIAPAPIYEEGNLIHRSIRDLYNRDIDEVIVEGEAGFRDARDYMKLIMPSHVKNVKPHPLDGQPLFAKHGVESYLASMFSPTVQLKSGGYIVIGITEALVAVDVNSGKSTKEGSIEDTATKTNLEAADEVARQMRLRDLAGLIVIDFIDMDERRNNAAVEKRLKEALKNDRARIQMGRISGFGLLEMSRQRLRPGMLEATTQACPHCHGTGLIRSDDSVALQILRALEEEGVKKRSGEVKLTVPVDICNYLMNEKREHLAAIEGRYEMAVRVVADPQLIAPDYGLEKFKTATRVIPTIGNVVQHDTSWTSDDDEAIEAEVDEVDAEERAEDGAPEARRDERQDERGDEADRRSDESDGSSRKKRRRRSRRRKPGHGGEDGQSSDAGSSEGRSREGPSEESRSEESRPGRRRSETSEDDASDDASDGASADDSDDVASPAEDDAPAILADAPAEVADGGDKPPVAEPAPKPRSRTRSRSKKVDAPEEAPAVVEEDAAEAAAEPEAETPASKPRSRSRAKGRATSPSASPAAGPSAELTATAELAESVLADAPDPQQSASQPEEPAPAEAEPPAAEVPAKPKRKGWWSFGS